MSETKRWSRGPVVCGSNTLHSPAGTDWVLRLLADQDGAHFVDGLALAINTFAETELHGERAAHEATKRELAAMRDGREKERAEWAAEREASIAGYHAVCAERDQLRTEVERLRGERERANEELAKRVDAEKEVERLKHELEHSATHKALAAAVAEVERLRAREDELMLASAKRSARIAELEAQLAEARKAPPLPESVEALLKNPNHDPGYLYVGMDVYQRAVRTAYSLGLAKGKDAEEKLALVLEAVRGDVADTWPEKALVDIAAIVEPPHVHTWRRDIPHDDEIARRVCACGAKQVGEWKDAPK